jgi:hypothetical protein
MSEPRGTIPKRLSAVEARQSALEARNESTERRLSEVVEREVRGMVTSFDAVRAEVAKLAINVRAVADAQDRLADHVETALPAEVKRRVGMELKRCAVCRDSIESEEAAEADGNVPGPEAGTPTVELT